MQHSSLGPAFISLVFEHEKRGKRGIPLFPLPHSKINYFFSYLVILLTSHFCHYSLHTDFRLLTNDWSYSYIYWRRFIESEESLGKAKVSVLTLCLVGIAYPERLLFIYINIRLEKFEWSNVVMRGEEGGAGHGWRVGGGSLWKLKWTWHNICILLFFTDHHISILEGLLSLSTYRLCDNGFFAVYCILKWGLSHMFFN